MTRQARVVLLVLLLACCSPVASADTLRVVRAVRLLTKPSSWDGLKIKTLHPPELVTTTGGKNGDYVRVRDQSGDEGWAYDPYLTEASPPPEEGNEEESSSTESSAIDTAWDKPAPQAETFHIHGQPCGPAGDGAETVTNTRKNRIDIPATYHAVPFAAVDKLPWPLEASTHRTGWHADQLAKIAPYEGVALTVTGYLAAVKPETGNKEDCNCGMTAADETDWHMALTEHQGEPEADAMVVETTPRIRLQHPGWTTTNLQPYIKGPDPIRVSGWLLMDPQHKAHLHPDSAGHPAYRNTLWEIHPITKIEVMKNGSWVDLDALGPT